MRKRDDKVGMNTLVAADLFAGAGGLSVGFQDAGFQIAFANDVSPEYAHTYQANHPGTRFFSGSIEHLHAKDIYRATGLSKQDVDVLIGGPPCQGFSINAPHRSTEDDRNHLFEHYGRLVLEGLRPKVILMENVPGLISLDHGRFLNAIYELFTKAGYRMRHMILCAAHYGVPQERWRLILIGTILSGEITFPEPTHHAPLRPNFTGARTLTWLPLITNGTRPPTLFDSLLTKHTTVNDALSDLPALAIEEGTEEMSYTMRPRTGYQRVLRNNSTILFNHVAGKLSPQNLERVRHVPPGGSWRDIPHDLLPKGMKRARRSDHTRRYGRLDPNGLSGTVLTKCDPHWGTFFHYEQDRTLTVREAARLQSFPDWYRFHGSRVSQYEQVGNAVPPLLAQTIAIHVRKTLFDR
jgi:DNA (cytosine-5)-methyltransferase 1